MLLPIPAINMALLTEGGAGPPNGRRMLLRDSCYKHRPPNGGRGRLAIWGCAFVRKKLVGSPKMKKSQVGKRDLEAAGQCRLVQWVGSPPRKA